MRAVLAGVAVLLAGCASTPAAPASVGLPEVPGISAEGVRLRTDEAVGGRLQVRVTNSGSAPFTVTAVQLDAPGFAVLPPTELDTEYPPGRVIDLPTPFGAVDCAVRPQPAVARLTVVRPGGAVEELQVPLAGSTLAEVHAQECAVRAVTEEVEVAVAGFTEDGATLRGEVVLSRRSGDRPAQVTFLAGSVVLEPVPDVDLPVTLAAGEAELRLPVTVQTARCDPHALAETKQPHVFPLTVVVGDEEAVPVRLPLDEAQRGQLQALLDRVCSG